MPQVIFKNAGNVYGKNHNAFNIAAVDKEDNSKILAWYTGYYNKALDSYKLYPDELTNEGKRAGYKLELLVIKADQVTMKDEAHE